MSSFKDTSSVIVSRTSTAIGIGGTSDALLRALLAYIARHGARFLFNNEPPPAPGWPRMRRGKVIV